MARMARAQLQRQPRYRAPDSTTNSYTSSPKTNSPGDPIESNREPKNDAPKTITSSPNHVTKCASQATATARAFKNHEGLI